MVLPRFAVFLTLLACVLVYAPRAVGAPISTPLETLRARATTVVIGTVRAHTGADPDHEEWFVDVQTSLRGTHKPGEIIVATRSPDGLVTVHDGARLVVFLDGTALRWVGELVAGPSLERGVILLHGFFDLNAHLVEPGIVTLRQLRALLDGDAPSYEFAVTLTFADDHGVLRASGKRFSVTWAPPSRGVRPIAPRVTGLALACLRPSSLFGVDWGAFDLSFSDAGCARASARHRALELRGKYVGVDAASGAIEVEASPDRPFLTEREFDAFAADGSIAEVRRVVRVRAADGETWRWRVGESLVDTKGRALAAGGMSIRSEQRAGAGVVTTTQELAFGTVTLTLQPAPDVGSPGGHPAGVWTSVATGKMGCKVARPGRPEVACALANEPPEIIRAR